MFLRRIHEAVSSYSSQSLPADSGLSAFRSARRHTLRPSSWLCFAHVRRSRLRRRYRSHRLPPFQTVVNDLGPPYIGGACGAMPTLSDMSLIRVVSEVPSPKAPACSSPLDRWLKTTSSAPSAFLRVLCLPLRSDDDGIHSKHRSGE